MSVWNFTNIKASRHPTKAIDDNASIDSFPKFFEDARLNYAENMLCGDDDAIAIIEMNELNQQDPKKYTWKDLKGLVAKYAGLLRRSGVGVGDVVCCGCRLRDARMPSTNTRCSGWRKLRAFVGLFARSCFSRCNLWFFRY